MTTVATMVMSRADKEENNMFESYICHKPLVLPKYTKVGNVLETIIRSHGIWNVITINPKGNTVYLQQPDDKMHMKISKNLFDSYFQKKEN